MHSNILLVLWLIPLLFHSFQIFSLGTSSAFDFELNFHILSITFFIWHINTRNKRISAFLLIILVFGGLSVSHRILSVIERSGFQIEGELIEIDEAGTKVHVVCIGSGVGVLLDSGLPFSTYAWHIHALHERIHTHLRTIESNQSYRICAFDRPGYLWSDPLDLHSIELAHLTSSHSHITQTANIVHHMIRKTALAPVIYVNSLPTFHFPYPTYPCG